MIIVRLWVEIVLRTSVEAKHWGYVQVHGIVVFGTRVHPLMVIYNVVTVGNVLKGGVIRGRICRWW